MSKTLELKDIKDGIEAEVNSALDHLERYGRYNGVSCAVDCLHGIQGLLTAFPTLPPRSRPAPAACEGLVTALEAAMPILQKNALDNCECDFEVPLHPCSACDISYKASVALALASHRKGT